MADGDDHAASSQTSAPAIPQFTIRDLHEWLDSVLNESTMGTVYSLEGYPNLAVKEILLDGLGKSNVDAIKLELATLPDLSHPGVLRHHQVVEDESFIYIVMNRHDKTLEQVFIDCKRRKIPVSAGVVLSILRQLSAALAYLHGLSGANTKGLVHRDLRPANIFISADGERFIIADFGLCKDALRCGSTIAGTAVYMAPEALLRNEASPASDVWSLGVIIYELVTLRRPDFLGGKEPAEVFIDGWRPDLSGVTDGFMQNVLERIFVLEPERRPTARELCKMLTAADIPIGELGHRYVALEDKCSALEAALNSANANIVLLKDELKVESDKVTALEAALDARSAEIASLKGALESRPSEVDALGQEPRLKTTGIDALEDQCKEYSAMIKALENRFTEVSGGMNTSSPQSNLSTLPRLIRAAYTNDTETVRVLIEEGVTGQRDEQGMTALMHAAQQGHIGPVRLLVKKEKGIKDKNGWTALMHAAHNGHPEASRILTPHEHGLQDLHGHTALMIVAQQRNLEMAKILLGREKGMKDKDGNTAFMHALMNKHTGIALLLRKHEAPSWTPLMCAAFTGNVTMARRHLHERDVKNSDGETALTIAARAGHKDIVELLDPTDENGVTALMRAVDRNDVDTVKALLPLQGGQKATGDVEIGKLTMYGGTALMRAVAHGYAEIMEMLVEKEGGMRDRNGKTALMIAAEKGHPECIKLLVRNVRERNSLSWTSLMYAACIEDADAVRSSLQEAGVKDSDGCTALVWAARTGHTECVKLLLEKEGGMQTSYGSTALMSAAEEGHAGAVEVLLEKEGRMKDSDGQTALMYAAQNGHSKCVRLLVKKEGGVQDIFGRTALMSAAEEGHTDCLALLLEKEGGMRDDNGKTALMLAARYGSTDCFKLLLEKEGGMKSNNGQTALMAAAKEGHSAHIALLLEKEGGMQDSDGWTALMWAVSCRQIECARLLAEKEKNVNRRKLLGIVKRRGNSKMMALLSE
ncbi:Kinase, NEK [Giardia duodenalis]|uniref:Kinase, NEK n=1 Tax=Giardia intestinalis (strain ATCC 50803 / WB clone C6) TaxID=184922 RepID=A0A644F1Q1_GIAIC|nr:Kinase, NEK [Giardia intestinalis]KAE8302556.1 Kinase, NEK [Giardia intestinalis]